MVQRIMFFVSSLNIGGVEKVMVDYANLLSINGYSICYTVMYPIDTNNSFYSVLSEKITIHSINTKRLRHCILKLRSVIKQFNPDIIITENERVLAAIIAKFTLPLSRVKIIGSQHNFLNNEEIKHKTKSIAITKNSAFFCYKIISVSKNITEMLIEQLKIKHHKVVTIYNPIDRNRICKLSKEYQCQYKNYILYIGRLSPVKNIPLLIGAFQILNKKYPKLKLLIIGDGEEKDLIVNLMEKSTSKHNIILLSAINNPYPYILNATIVAIPSFSEGLSLVCLESLTLGKTIVSTPNKGCQELLNRDGKQYGYISKSIDDPEEFADNLEKAYLNPISPTLLSESTCSFDKDAKFNEIISIWSDL